MVTQPHAVEETDRTYTQFSWQPDLVSPDPRRGYDNPISRSNWDEMRAAIDRNKRKRSPEVETGGLLFGRRDNASKVIWVDEATGPPPDSVHRRDLFVCGTEDTQAANEERKSRTHSAVQYVGMWHTHPGSAPSPSGKDLLRGSRPPVASRQAPGRHCSPRAALKAPPGSGRDQLDGRSSRVRPTLRTPSGAGATF